MITEDTNAPVSTGLVLEGGGMRGMFTSGVLDVLMQRKIQFDALVGVSSGVLFGCNYKSGQMGRALRYNLIYRDNPEYMSWRSLWETGDYVNVDFSYNELPNRLDPFDYEAFRRNPMRFYAVCTDIEKGLPVYHCIDDAYGVGMKWMRASASMPIFADPVKIDGRHYLDGGMTDSIPLRFLQQAGCKKNVVILTQPWGYRKKKSHVKLALKVALHKYPLVADMMSIRNVVYNQQLQYLASQVELGNTFVIAPDSKLDIGRLGQSRDKIIDTYDSGVRKALELMPKLKQFLGCSD